MDKDEIIFSGAYKDFRLGVNYDVTGKDMKDVAGVLISISAVIEPQAFRFAGVNIKAVGEITDRLQGNGIPAVYGFFEANPPKELKDSLAKTIPDPLLLPAAESCLLNALLVKAGVAFKPKIGTAVKPAAEEPGDVIAFIGKYGQWVAIKKLGLENVKDYEVAGILAGVNHTIVNKAFDFQEHPRMMRSWHP